MDFSFTEEHRELTGLTRTILASLTPERLRAVESGPDRYDPELWATLRRSGILDDYGLIDQCGVLVEMGRAVAPVPYLFSVVVAGSALTRFADGPTDALCTAALSDDEVHVENGRLTGSKSCVPAGGIASVYLVRVGDDVYTVHSDAPGLTVERQRIVDNDSEAWLEFTDTPATYLGGPEVLEWLTTRATVGLCASQLGVAERALELTVEHARTRIQFDRPIGSFQAVAQRLADAYVDVEAIRLTMWQAAWRVSEGLPAETEVATAKFWAADAGHRVAHTAVHVHGGMGIDMDYPVHRYFVAAKRNEFALGGATAQLRKLGAVLAATPA